MKPGFEDRLDSLRREASATGSARGRGVDVTGGPLPPLQRLPGYAGEPIVRPPVWSWEIPLYFFIGGLTGMAGVLASAAWLFGEFRMAGVALWIAAIGTVLSTILLILDLGRPMRFLYMLRVFKFRSPMSMGSWILSAFGAHAVGGLITFQLAHHLTLPPFWQTLLDIVAVALVAGAGFWGMFLATYTGVLVGVSVVPAWFLHRITLPIHFGTVGMGSAAALLELLGFRTHALWALGLAAAIVETLLWLVLEFRNHGAADRAVHHGKSGWMIRASDLCTGPLAVVVRLLGWVPVAAVLFLAGGLLSRFGWISAGRASGRDPESVLASQGASGRH